MAEFRFWLRCLLFPRYRHLHSHLATVCFSPIHLASYLIAIVIISRYSTRVSKLTGHNTISVLATLLLLSYTKLLLAILSSLSYTQLHLDGRRVFLCGLQTPTSDSYMAGKHVWLLLMSLIMIFAYIVPFTFLVSLGPLLISK